MRAWFPLALVALLCCGLPAQAQQIALTTEVDYLSVEQRLRDPDQRTTTSGFFPRLDLSLTGPVRPGARLYLDLTGGLSESSFGISRQSTNDMHLVLRGEAPHYKLSLRYGDTRFTNTTDTLDLAPTRLTSDSKETGVTLILREPAWPVVNLQYSRFTTDSGAAGATTRTDSTDSRVAALYDLAPLHFRLDESRQTATSVDSTGSESNARRLAVSLDTALFPKLSLYGDLELTHTDTRAGGAAVTGGNGRLGQLRLSTALTPKVALDAEVHSQQTDPLAPLIGVAPNGFSTHGSSLSMRSEVVPGLQLNLSKSADHSEYGGRITDVSSLYGDVLAQLNGRNNLALSFSPSRTTLAGYPTTNQQAYQASWTSQLDSRTDFVASLEHFASSSASLGSDRTESKYLSVRYRPDLQTTVGVGLLWNTTEATGPGTQTSQQERGLDFDLAWLPTSTLTLGLDLSLTRLSGASQARVKVPALDLRWQPDAKGAFYLSWRLQDSVQQGLEAFSQLQTTAFSARFQRQLSRRSNVSLSYDVMKFNQGPLAYERRLGVSITSGLGR